jgi:3-dehydroquinate synthase
MKIVKVDISERPYDIKIEHGLLSHCGDILKPLARDNRLLVVTDTQVEKYVWPQFSACLRASGIQTEVFILPHGESSKSWLQLEALTDWLLSHHAERSDHIIALGGGVVGDITGFAAHIIKRGCAFVQIPTTLLAQVDSSVGGKTAINNRIGKNLIGAFHQPATVLIDPQVLHTLPTRELAAGFAEAVKYGLIDDPEFFNWCEGNAAAFFAGDAAVREHIIVRSVTAKARIVAADEHERNGTRALLNLGHTFGHALEAETGFSDTLLHGEAVAAGMALAFRYSARLGLCDTGDAARVTQLLHIAGLPTTLASAGIAGSDIAGSDLAGSGRPALGEVLVSHMLHDKKMSSGTLPFLLAKGIGQTFLSKDVVLSDVAAFLDEEAMR